MRYFHCHCTFLTGMLILLAWLPAFAQDSVDNEPDPGDGSYEEEISFEKPEKTPIPVERFSDLRFYLGQYVVIYGITGERRDDVAANTRVYKLVDDWNGTVWVRTNEEWPVRGQHFRVWGYVTRENNEIVVTEDRREYAPPESEETGMEEGSEEESKGLPLLTIIGIVIAAAALIAGIVLMTLPKRRESPQSILASGPTVAATSSIPRVTIPPATAASAKPVTRTTKMWGQLNIISGPDKGKMFPLFSTVITIGRGKDMEIYLPDDSNVVSTKHATISVAADGRLVFTDESTNGSKVDERAVHKSEVALTPDATIVIGPYELKLSVYEIPKTTAGEGGTVMLGEISKPSAATMQYLGRDLEVVEGGKDKGKKHCITAYETKIGRAPDQDFVLEDDFISRKHAAVHFSDGKWTVVNLSTSEQGTTVNGEKIKEAVELKPGDRIKLGKTVLEFKSISVD